MGASEEQEIIQSAVREFAGNELKPLAFKIDSDGAIPSGLFEKLASVGLFGILCPQEHGGVGAGIETMAKIAPELSQACASTALVFSYHSLACSLLNEFGSQEQKAMLLPDLASGKKIGTIAISEGFSSLDLDSVKTFSTMNNDSYITNGLKPYVVNGSFAHIFIILSRTTNNGHQFLIVQDGSKGLVQGRRIGLLGVRAAGISHLYLDGVNVPKEDALGTKENSPIILRSAQEGTWLGISGIALGIARAALNAATKYANQRTQFGKPIGRFEAVQEMIYQIYSNVESTHSLLGRVSNRKNNEKSSWREAAALKVLATSTATKSAKLALRIHGGYGFIKDYPVERFVRDARTLEILGDRNEDLKAASARSILGYDEAKVV